ncbi:MAG TPA: glycosyltransferase family 2 protein [Thermoanaerobaculia bacterium]|jgi:GT2 family glycosyltransferase|nr:glycosyltransferase family 2 protein [Thermoanaerobaculia bacterium]
MKPARVSVAVLSWNGRHHLETCLAALAGQSDPGVPWEILVLDNGSTDGTAEWLRRDPPPGLTNLRLVESPVNLGFCAGNNRLVAEAEGDAVAFLNNDTRPRPDWLARLVAALSEAPDDVAAVSGQIVDWAGERLDFARGAMTFDGHAFQVDYRRPLDRAKVPDEGEELLFACGGNLLIRKRSFLEAGGFDEAYFAYLEDVDLGWRLWSGGERVTFAPGAIVHHRSSATSDLLGLFNRGFLFERNAFLTAYKNYEAGIWERLMPAVLLAFLSRTQSMLVENNPGGAAFGIDPYAGWIANTAPGKRGPAGSAAASLAVSSPALREPWTPAGILRRFRRHGARESLRRVLVKIAGRLGSDPAGASGAPRVTDERTIAQFRTVAYLLGHLDEAAKKRAAIQARRKRTDREIFARFPLYLVPTYPGDADLFASEGFASWLPEELPLVRALLADLMEVG